MALTREDLRSVPTYAAAPLDGVTLDLRDNVNLFGAPRAALAAARDAAGAVREYPHVNGEALTAAIAAAIGILPTQVVAGCGSDDVIHSAIGAVAAAGARVAHALPTFSMVPVFARLHGLEPIGVPLAADGAMDVDALLATEAPLIYVCSPNNPTGTVTPTAELHRLFDAAPGVVILDEAYGEFTDAHDLRRAAVSRPNVLVTRTFSKAWGLAGLRVGYGVGDAGLVAAVTKSRGPYKVNAIAEAAAVAALTGDGAWMRAAAAEAREARDRLAALLGGRLGVRVWPSEGNFLFLEVAARADEIAERFRQRGIGVRAFTALPGIGDAIRIGVAPWPDLQRVADVALELWP